MLLSCAAGRRRAKASGRVGDASKQSSGLGEFEYTRAEGCLG